MLFGDVAACHKAECVLCAVQNVTEYNKVCTIPLSAHVVIPLHVLYWPDDGRSAAETYSLI
jgi:hypothetical protein